MIFTYAERIDLGDFDGVADLLADAQVTAEGSDRVVSGRDGVRAMYEQSTRRYPGGTPLTKHLTTNVVIEVDDDDDDRAAARSYFTVLQAVPGALALQPIIAGRYRDRFEREWFEGAGGAWHFAARHITVDLTGDLGHHLLFELPPR